MWRDLVVGSMLMGVGYFLTTQSTSHRAETFHAFQPTKDVVKVNLQKWERLWDFIANDKADPSFVNNLAPFVETTKSGMNLYDLGQQDSPNHNLKDVTWSYDDYWSKWSGNAARGIQLRNNWIPLATVLGFAHDLTPYRYTGLQMNTSSWLGSSAGQSYWAYRGSWNHNSRIGYHEGMEFCCPTQATISAAQGPLTERDEEHQAMSRTVTAGVAAYRKYFDQSGQLRKGVNLTTEKNIKDLSEDLGTLQWAYYTWKDLCTILFFNEIMKPITTFGGAIMEIDERHAPRDDRYRKTYPEIEGFYYVNDSTSLTALLAAFPKKYHKYITQHSETYTYPDAIWNGEYTLWCDFLQQQYDALKNINFGLITSFAHDTLIKPSHSLTMIEPAEMNLQNTKDHLKELRKELRQSKKSDVLIKKELDELKQEHNEQKATLRKQLNEEYKWEKESLEDDWERIKKNNSERIKQEQTKIKEYTQEIADMKDYLKDVETIAASQYGAKVKVDAEKAQEYDYEEGLPEFQDW